MDTVRNEMETVMRLDPDYEQRGAQRVLARVYYRAPFFKGGDKQRSIELLQDCLRRYPSDSFALLYLADDYLSVGRRAEARSLLERILDLCPDPLFTALSWRTIRLKLATGFSMSSRRRGKRGHPTAHLGGMRKRGSCK